MQAHLKVILALGSPDCAHSGCSGGHPARLGCTPDGYQSARQWSWWRLASSGSRVCPANQGLAITWPQPRTRTGSRVKNPAAEEPRQALPRLGTHPRRSRAVCHARQPLRTLATAEYAYWQPPTAPCGVVSVVRVPAVSIAMLTAEGCPRWPSERSTPSCRFTPAAE